MPKIAIIALDLPKNSRGVDYLKMSFDDQLKFLINTIKKAHATVKAKDPNATIVIVWRENGIINHNKNLLDRILTPQQNNKFKSECRALTGELKNLYIISGSVSHYTTIDKIKDPKSKANKILDGYAKFSFVTELENKREHTSLEDTDYYKHFQRFKNSVNNYQVKVESNNYNFFDNRIIAKRKKVAPFYELPDDIVMDNETVRFIYAFNRNFPAFNIDVKTSSGLQSFPCIVELCREGVLGVANYLIKKGELTKPYFRFILSDSINASDIAEPKLARFTIRVDSDPEDSITVYVNNPTADSNLNTCKSDDTEHKIQQEDVQVEFLRLNPFAESSESFLLSIQPTHLKTESLSFLNN